MAAQELDRPGCLWQQGGRPPDGRPGPFPAQSSIRAGVRIAGRNGPRNRKALPKIERKLPKSGRC
jgi:hypothetical protein